MVLYVATDLTFSSRRQMLGRFANGFGMLGVASLLAQDIRARP